MKKYLDFIETSEGYIPVTGGNVWYQIVGSGASIPLLTLHGGPGYPHDYLESLGELGDERPIIYYDQLGCGKSERPKKQSLWKVERFVAELDQVIQALGLKEVHIYGHSWGSMLAVDYALALPSELVSLILASPALSISQWIADSEVYRQALPFEVLNTLKRYEREGNLESEEYLAAKQVFNRRHNLRLDEWPESVQRTYDGVGLEVYKTMWGSGKFKCDGNLRGYDRTDQIHQITVPTLFTCGRYDEATSYTTKWYMSKMGQAEISIFEDSSHHPHIEEKDKYLHILRGFLKRVESI